MSLLLDEDRAPRPDFLIPPPLIAYGTFDRLTFGHVIPFHVAELPEPRLLVELEDDQLEDEYWKAVEDEAQVDFL